MRKNNKLWISLIFLFVCASRSAAQNSPHGSLAMECTSCHLTTSWSEMKTPMDFNHTSTSFTLSGQHATTACKQCHTTLRFSGAPTDCFTCHREDFPKMTMPDHQRGQFSHDCTTCHSTNGWRPSIFEHRKTNFQLVGSHLAVDCFSCHQNSKFAGTSTDCYQCHRTEFVGVLTPNHQRGQFSHDCLTCHTMNGWRPSTFDHAKTNFPLQGAHQTVDCFSCHTNSRFAGTPTDCFSCHQTEFSVARVPDHNTAKFSHDCTTCHTVIVWRPSTFDHTKTNFQLLGAHRAADCASCHAGGRFAGTPSACYACHQTDFNKGLNHLASQFSHECSPCHSMDAWTPAVFDHNKTSFPLLGAHQSVQCSSCHKDAGALPSDCYPCHQSDFNKVQTPNHQLGLFSHDCTTCHTVNVWKPSTFNHANTSFPLTGAHQTTDCIFCHTNGQYSGIRSDCFSCHQNDFSKVTDPNHVTGGFDHNCAMCHSTSSWTPATFDHNKTNFKLTGAHSQTECVRCHVSNRFAGTPTDCYSCHQQDYSSTTNPNHSSAKYPVTCASCHATSSWRPATFDHTPFFPIGAGSKHSPGRWTFCSDCHTNPSTPTTFECINCHEHSKDKMDSEHKNRAGYAYQSSACYKCHPQGR